MGEKKTEIIRLLKKFKRNISEKYKVENIILFGSQVTGKARKGSDIDLIVIMREKNKLEVLPKLYHEWHINQRIDYPVDFICFTPEEFMKKKKQVSIVSQALKEGIEI